VDSDVDQQVCHFSHTAGNCKQHKLKKQKGRNHENIKKQKGKFDKIKGNNTG